MNQSLKTYVPCCTVLLAILLLFQGCARTILTSPPDTQASRRQQQQITNDLLVFYTMWRRTPYKLGGTSRKGIDCSGFTYRFFVDYYDLTLPRTVKGQLQVGEQVAKRDLQPGDLVFFKTGFFQRHVGICMDDQRFAHASSSTGVMISRLDKGYWNKKYWGARRLLM